MRLLTILVLALTLLAPRPGAAQTVEFIIHAAPADIQGIAGTFGLTIERADDITGIYLVSSAAVVHDLKDQIELDPRVLDVERNEAVALPEAPRANGGQPPAEDVGGLPNRTLVTYFNNTVWAGYALQPAGTIMRLPATQKSYGTGAGIVAVIDTGIDATHPVLAGAVIAGYDFVHDSVDVGSDLGDISQDTAAILEGGSGSEAPRAVLMNAMTAAIVSQDTAAILEGGDKVPEAFGHGTMVAGLIRLVAPGARIMPLRAFHTDGTADIYDIVRSIYYAVDHGARVINMSFTLATASPELVRAINYATDHNVICVAAAGNSGQETVLFPSALRNVIGVGSTTSGDQRSPFSNYGTALVKIAAPGERLITAYPGNNYAAVWGTSFSAALVSGAASLMVAVKPGIEPLAAEGALKSKAIAGAHLGAGRIDLYLAIKAARK